MAQAAQSKADFISKMSIASKEARETKHWLRLLSESGYLDNYTKKAEIFNVADSIINIITKIVKTSSNPKLNTQHPTPKTALSMNSTLALKEIEELFGGLSEFRVSRIAKG